MIKMFSVDITTFELKNIILVLASTLALGLLIAFTYGFTSRKKGTDKSFLVSLFLLPTIVAAIIMLVGTNYASAFSLAGVFTLVRFRTNISDVKNMLYLFLTVVLGLAGGMGYIGYSALLVVLICALLIAISYTKIEKNPANYKRLKIRIPEDLNYSNLFDEVFEKYTTRSCLKKVKTTDFGTMFELVYDIELKDKIDEKSFIDELRVLNGNLNIALLSDYTNEIRTYNEE